MALRRNPSAHDTDVITIGAGTAGRRLGERLKAAGIRTIILEARNLMNGRIESRRFWWGNTPLQIPLGAEFIHASRESEHRWRRIIKDHDFSVDEITSNGQTILGQECYHDRHDRIRKSSGMLRELKQKITKHFTEGGHDMDVASFIRLCPLPSVPDRDYKGLLQAILANEYAEDINRLSLRTVLEPDSYTMKNYRIREGFGEFVRALGKGSDIRVNSAVDLVRWEAGRVMVKTEGGSVFRAKQCAISSPIGMLQSGVPVFDPELPKWKADAIRQFVPGRIVKVIMRFRERFWKPEMMFLRGGNQQLSWPPMMHHDKDAPFLTALIGGEEADRLADLGGGRAAREVANEIMRMHGITNPRGHFVDGSVTAWHKKKYIMTGYSSLAIGADPDARKNLQRPIDDTLFWLGEATSSDHPATVYGALESADAAADEIIAMHNQQKTD